MGHGLWVSSTNTKGQATIPGPIRNLLKIKAGDKVGFKVHGKHVEIVPVTVKEKPLSFNKKEWNKIEKLRTKGKGKIFQSAKEANAYLKSL